MSSDFSCNPITSVRGSVENKVNSTGPRILRNITHSAVEAQWSTLGFHCDIAPTNAFYENGFGTAVRYRDDVLYPIAKLYSTPVGASFVLMDKNARHHRTAFIVDFLESEGIAQMEWPVYSLQSN